MGYEGTRALESVNSFWGKPYGAPRPMDAWFLKDGKIPTFHNEVEAKVDTTVGEYGARCEAVGMTQLEPLTLVTTWYDKGTTLPDGVSVRIRVARTDEGKERYFVAIKKKNKDAVSKSQLTTLRRECEWETKNLVTAQAELTLAVQKLYPRGKLSFESGTTMTKRRVTYVHAAHDATCRDVCAHVRFDFDEIIEYGDVQLDPIPILEIEASSEKLVLDCARRVGIPREKLSRAGSTRKKIEKQLLEKVFRDAGV